MKVAVFASGEFALPLVKHLLDTGALAVLFTKTDKPKGRGMKLRPTPVAEVVGDGVPVIKADKLNKDLLKRYLNYDVDLSLVVDYGIYIPSYFYTGDVPFMVNIHPSLLPRWRGPAPIQWTIYSGDEKTGITFHLVSKEIDAGDILYQVEYPLSGREKATELEKELSHKLVDVWRDFLALYKEGFLKPKKQGDDYTYAPMFERKKFHIDFSLPCDEVDRLVRALSEVPGAYAIFRGKRVKILYGRCEKKDVSADVGSIVWVQNGEIGIQTGDGVYIPMEVKPEGKRNMAIKDFILGYKPEVGQKWS